MTFIKTGGDRWSPQLVGWGSPGATPNTEILGYEPKNVSGKRGRPSGKDRKSLTVNLWSVTAVYALFDGDRLRYVGEGQLGPRLLAHYRDDSLAGRWNSFSFLSPATYQRPGDSSSSAKMLEWEKTTEVNLDGKEIVELIELCLIRLGKPTDNSQDPDAAKTITWLEQESSSHAPKTVDQRFDDMVARFDKLEELLKGKAPGNKQAGKKK